MQKFACLSHHAFIRLHERTKMSSGEIADLLDHRVYVDSGHIPGFMRHHLVFYSPADQTCFVAVQDMRCRTVITILPLTYQARLTWAISNETCDRAKILYDKHVENRKRVNNDKTAETTSCLDEKIAQERRFVVSIHYFDDEGHFKTKKLASFLASQYDFKVNNLLEDKNLPNMLQSHFIASNIQVASIDSLSVRNGQKACPLFIDLH